MRRGILEDCVLQLNPPIPLNTPKGEGFAYFVQDLGLDHDLIWTVFLQSGEIWSFMNREVRAVENITHGRMSPFKFETKNVLK